MKLKSSGNKWEDVPSVPGARFTVSRDDGFGDKPRFRVTVKQGNQFACHFISEFTPGNLESAVNNCVNVIKRAMPGGAAA